MRIQVLGPGCPRCKMLTASVEQAIQDLELDDATIEKVTSIADIAGFGVMMTPALVVDGQVKSAGKVLSPAEAAKILKP
ncbi:MAG TPA: thioredoxin family protein, partial [Armatimonadota bacterium]|nr:thioredoxin family protein [Armatimonadota bacterium]